MGQSSCSLTEETNSQILSLLWLQKTFDYFITLLSSQYVISFIIFRMAKIITSLLITGTVHTEEEETHNLNVLLVLLQRSEVSVVNFSVL